MNRERTGAAPIGRLGRDLRRRLADVLLWALVLTVAAASGCGRKLPPQPPVNDRAPAVVDLAYRLEGDYLTLAWTVPPPGAKGTRPVAGFRVERAERPADPAECAACPLDFRTIGEVRTPGRIAGGQVRFSETIAPGFRYVYRVVALDERRLPGEPSAPVSLIF